MGDHNKPLSCSCPACGNQDVYERWIDESFKHGVGDHSVIINVRIPILHCRGCRLEFTDYRAEEFCQTAINRQSNLQNEVARLTAINSALVDKSNACTIRNARLSEENQKLLQLLQEWVVLGFSKSREAKTHEVIGWKNADSGFYGPEYTNQLQPLSPDFIRNLIYKYLEVDGQQLGIPYDMLYAFANALITAQHRE